MCVEYMFFLCLDLFFVSSYLLFFEVIQTYNSHVICDTSILFNVLNTTLNDKKLSKTNAIKKSIYLKAEAVNQGKR